MAIEQAVAELEELLHGLDVAGVHGGAREEQQVGRGGLVEVIDVPVPADELIILGNHLSRVGIGVARVKAHGRSAISDQLADGGADAGALVFAQSERLAAGGAADVSRVQGAFAEVSVLEVRVKGGVAGAVPQVIFILGPQLLGQQAAFVGVDLTKAPDVVPLADDQTRLQRTAVLYKHFIKTFLGGDL